MGKRRGQTSPPHAAPKRPVHHVKVSVWFVMSSFAVACLFAVGVGRTARMHLMLVAISGNLYEPQCGAKPSDPLPSLIVKDPDLIPNTRYSSKYFDSSMSAASSAWLTASRAETKDDATLILHDTNTSTENAQPSAEHLMVDIKNVDSAFLNSEGRLANAIVQVMNEAHLTLLSYHCHGLVPIGVSCVGVLKQNYISFHTWPEEGVITLDLCVGDAKSLLPVLPILERAFGVPQKTGALMPEMRWTHKIRGFPTDERAIRQQTTGQQRQRWHISRQQ